MAGQSWAAYDLKCSDMTSMIGNSVSNTVFDAAKAVDRITITTYQSAAGEGLLSWLKQRVDQLISQTGQRDLLPLPGRRSCCIGAIWLAWQGLIRKRATRTIEGTIWMVVACAAAIWLIGRPADFTGLGQKVSDGISQVLNVAFSRLPVSGGTSCVPVGKGDPQSTGENFAYTGGNEVVSQNADELWAVLVCKPWLAGEFGTMSTATGNGAKPSRQPVRPRAALVAGIAVNETAHGADLTTAETGRLSGDRQQSCNRDPAVYPLFQGKQWATRLEVAFSALFAALVAGALVLLIAITLIVLKLGFLLLLVAGPFFLIIGTHPGFGRVVAIRWFEMLVGVLLKQAAVALILSVLLYCYALVMAVSDAALPWVFKILMIALLTVAVFIYRRPFQHLFSAVGYDMVGSRERSDTELVRAGSTARPEHRGRRHRGCARVRRLPGGPLGPAQPGPGGAAWPRRRRAGRPVRPRARRPPRRLRPAKGRREPRPRAPSRPRLRPTARPTMPTRARRPGPGWPPGPAAGPPRAATASPDRRRRSTCRTGRVPASARRPAGRGPGMATPRPAGATRAPRRGRPCPAGPAGRHRPACRGRPCRRRGSSGQRPGGRAAPSATAGTVPVAVARSGRPSGAARAAAGRGTATPVIRGSARPAVRGPGIPASGGHRGAPAAGSGAAVVRCRAVAPRPGIPQRWGQPGSEPRPGPAQRWCQPRGRAGPRAQRQPGPGPGAQPGPAAAGPRRWPASQRRPARREPGRGQQRGGRRRPGYAVLAAPGAPEEVAGHHGPDPYPAGAGLPRHCRRARRHRCLPAHLRPRPPRGGHS